MSWALAVPLVRTAGFLALMPLVLHALAPSELGLWYVLSNIALLGGAVELQLSANIARFASYYMAGRANVPRLGLAEGDLPSGTPLYPELAGLVRARARSTASSPSSRP